MNIIIKACLNLKTYSLRPKKKVNVTRNLTDLNKNPNFNFFFNFEEKQCLTFAEIVSKKMHKKSTFLSFECLCFKKKKQIGKKKFDAY